MGSLPPVAGFLIAHGYLLILPVAVVEGPIVSFVSGILAAEGVLSWYWALAALIVGDLLGDVIFYWIGRSGGAQLGWLSRRFGLRSDGETTKRFAEGFHRDAVKILIVGKWTHTIGALVLISAGMARLNLTRFLLVNLIATIPKSGALFAAGYFSPASFEWLTHHWVLGSVTLFLVGLVVILVTLRRLILRPGFMNGTGR